AVDDAAAGGLAPADTTAQLDRFARDDFRTGVADVHAVGVVDPGHGLFVGAQVGRHDILAWANDAEYLFREAAGPSVQVAARQYGGIAGDAALGAAKGQVHDAALPGHPHGQGGHFAQVDAGMEAQATLGGAAGQAVLHTKADEALGAPVAVHADGDADD